MSGYRCATTRAILEPFEYNAAIQTPARLMIEAPPPFKVVISLD